MKTTTGNMLLVLFLLTSFYSNAQNKDANDFYHAISAYDLSMLWHADSIQIEGDGEKIAFPEPLGYIDDNYQRFYIHYTLVTKSKDNPYVYLVHGKTKVSNNICSFTGTIEVIAADTASDPELPDLKQYKTGSVLCNVVFYEDSSQASSGFIKGQLNTDFYIDPQNCIHYDALLFVADGFLNNQCEATWTSYKTGRSKKCNWGDFRIPDSDELDVGAGDFGVNEKYIKNGWQNYANTQCGDEKKEEEAWKIENMKWWE